MLASAVATASAIACVSEDEVEWIAVDVEWGDSDETAVVMMEEVVAEGRNVVGCNRDAYKDVDEDGCDNCDEVAAGVFLECEADT